jgi:hypothetical protein
MPTGSDNGGGDGSSTPSSGDNGYSPSLKDNNMRVTSEAEGMAGYEPKKVGGDKYKKPDIVKDGWEKGGAIGVFSVGLFYTFDFFITGNIANFLTSIKDGKDTDGNDLSLTWASTYLVLGFADIGALNAIQRHHLIPKQIFDEFNLGKYNFVRDHSDNLLELPSWFHANHPRYSNMVKQRINRLKDNGELTLNNLIKLENELRDQVVKLLKEAEKSTTKYRLNDCFPPKK